MILGKYDMAIYSSISPIKIVLAGDGSCFANAAVDLMTHMSWPTGTTTYVVTVASSPRKPDSNLADSFDRLNMGQLTDCLAAQTQAAKAANRLCEHGLVVQTDVQGGPPASVILHRIESLAPDLVVLGAKGLATKSAKIGTTAVRVAHRAHTSVLLARPGEFVRPLKVLLAVDGSRLAQRAVEFLCQLSLPQWAKITIVSVAESTTPVPSDMRLAEAYISQEVWASQPPAMTTVHEAYATDVMRYLHHYGVRGHISIAAGDAAHEILSIANYQQTNLIVVGAHSQPHPDQLHLGSVTRQLIEEATCSVMVMR